MVVTSNSAMEKGCPVDTFILFTGDRNSVRVGGGASSGGSPSSIAVSISQRSSLQSSTSFTAPTFAQTSVAYTLNDIYCKPVLSLPLILPISPPIPHPGTSPASYKIPDERWKPLACEALKHGTRRRSHCISNDEGEIDVR